MNVDGRRRVRVVIGIASACLVLTPPSQ